MNKTARMIRRIGSMVDTRSLKREGQDEQLRERSILSIAEAIVPEQSINWQNGVKVN